jgi:hypothetical protein
MSVTNVTPDTTMGNEKEMANNQRKMRRHKLSGERRGKQCLKRQ